MLQCCVCLSSVVCNVLLYCGLTVRPMAKVTIDNLAYKESTGSKMNDLDLCLEFV